jgi:predicted dehydrogenase
MSMMGNEGHAARVMSRSRDDVGVAIVGVGGWGQSLLRVIAALPGAHVRHVVDARPEALARAESVARDAALSREVDGAFADSSVAAVVIATPAASHAPLVRAAIASGKHVFVEKPLCVSAAEGRALAAQAEAASRILMVGHLLLYHPAIVMLKRMIDAGELGALCYLYGTRVNLGIVRSEENAWWSLAPHDISVMLHLVGSSPLSVAARGGSYLGKGVEDVVFATLRFDSGVLGHIHASWLDPNKVRKLTVVGKRRMASFDDTHPSEKLRIYDKGADAPEHFDSFAEIVALRHGDIVIPRVDNTEPLRIELRHFLDCVKTGSQPTTGAADAIAVLEVLEAGERSLEMDGAPVTLPRRSEQGR